MRSFFWRFFMKCNFKNNFLKQKQAQINLINSFRTNFIEGNEQDLIDKEELQKSLNLLLKNQSQG